MRSEKGFIWNFISIMLTFSFVSIMYLTFAILNFAIWNDYVIYNMQNITEQLETQGTIKMGVANWTLSMADQYRETNFHYDDIWFFAYMVFVISTLIGAYKSRQQNYFSFLSFLFYGIMFVLFLLTIFSTLTNWWNDEILTKMLPNTVILLPKFYYYLNHIGIFSTVHLALCLIVNLFDFDFALINAKKKKESDAIDEEVV